MATLPDPPVRDRVLDERGYLTQPWRVWFVDLARYVRSLLGAA